MKANELMIGDWVTYGYFHYETGEPIEKVFQVTQIEAELGEYYVWDKDGRVCTPDLLGGIRISPYILQNNGFDLVEVGDNGASTPPQFRDRFEKWLLKTTWKDVVLWYDRLANYYNLDAMPTARLHYFHELQHALRLCGIEKEIEL